MNDLRPSPANSADFRPDVQGLRAIAVAIVVAYHAGFVLDGGFVGVDAFFVISGFVITRMLLREGSTTGKFSFSNFYLRRVRRILPALAVALTGTLLLGILLAPLGAQTTAARTGIAASLINANSYLTKAGGGGGYFGVDAAANPLLHTWSLAVEEQFYLVFPALLALAWRFGRRKRLNVHASSSRLLIGAIAISFALCLLLTGRHLDPWGYGRQIAFYAAAPRAWEFAAGALIAALPRQISARSSRTGLATGIAGLAILGWATLAFSDATVFPGAAALVPVVGTMMLIAAGSAAKNPVSTVLGTRPMRYIGDISYAGTCGTGHASFSRTRSHPTRGGHVPPPDSLRSSPRPPHSNSSRIRYVTARQYRPDEPSPWASPVSSHHSPQPARCFSATMPSGDPLQSKRSIITPT